MYLNTFKDAIHFAARLSEERFKVWAKENPAPIATTIGSDQWAAYATKNLDASRDALDFGISEAQKTYHLLDEDRDFIRVLLVNLWNDALDWAKTGRAE